MLWLNKRRNHSNGRNEQRTDTQEREVNSGIACLYFLWAIPYPIQIITGIFLGLHYTSDLNSAYSSLFFFIREIYYGWCLRYLHSSGASFVFLFLFLHLGRAISYGSYFYNPNTWFSGILLFFFLMATAFIGYVLPFGQMSFWGATVITNLLSPFPSLIEWVCGGHYVYNPSLKRFLTKSRSRTERKLYSSSLIPQP